MKISTINRFNSFSIQKRKTVTNFTNLNSDRKKETTPGIEWYPLSVLANHDADTQAKIYLAYGEMKDKFKNLEDAGMKIKIHSYTGKGKEIEFPKGTLLLITTTLNDEMLTQWDNFNWGHWVIDPNVTSKENLKETFATIIDYALKTKAGEQLPSEAACRSYNPIVCRGCLSCG